MQLFVILIKNELYINCFYILIKGWKFSSWIDPYGIDQEAKWWQLVYCVREWQKTRVRHFEDSLKAAFEQAKQAEDLLGSCNHFFQRGQISDEIMCLWTAVEVKDTRERSVSVLRKESPDLHFILGKYPTYEQMHLHT